MTEAASLAERVIRPKDQVAQRDRLARLSAELARRTARRRGGNRKTPVEPNAALIERLEGQIQRHHLGQRRRIGQLVGTLLAEHLAGIGVKQDPGEDRPGRDGSVGRRHTAVRTRLGRGPGDKTERDRRRQDRRPDAKRRKARLANRRCATRGRGIPPRDIPRFSDITPAPRCPQPTVERDPPAITPRSPPSRVRKKESLCQSANPIRVRRRGRGRPLRSDKRRAKRLRAHAGSALAAISHPILRLILYGRAALPIIGACRNSRYAPIPTTPA